MVADPRNEQDGGGGDALPAAPKNPSRPASIAGRDARGSLGEIGSGGFLGDQIHSGGLPDWGEELMAVGVGGTRLACCFGGAGERRWDGGMGGSKELNAHPCSEQGNKIEIGRAHV